MSDPADQDLGAQLGALITALAKLAPMVAMLSCCVWWECGSEDRDRAALERDQAREAERADRDRAHADAEREFCAGPIAAAYASVLRDTHERHSAVAIEVECSLNAISATGTHPEERTGAYASADMILALRSAIRAAMSMGRNPREDGVHLTLTCNYQGTTPTGAPGFRMGAGASYHPMTDEVRPLEPW